MPTLSISTYIPLTFLYLAGIAAPVPRKVISKFSEYLFAGGSQSFSKSSGSGEKTTEAPGSVALVISPHSGIGHSWILSNISAPISLATIINKIYLLISFPLRIELEILKERRKEVEGKIKRGEGK